MSLWREISFSFVQERTLQDQLVQVVGGRE